MAISYTMTRPVDRSRFISPHHMYSLIGDGKILVALSGIVVIDFVGDGIMNWRKETYQLGIDIRGAVPPDKGIQLINYVPFATINAIYNSAVANDGGHAVDAFRIVSPETPKTTYLVLEVDVAVRDNDAWLSRVGYYLTATARIVDLPLLYEVRREEDPVV